MRLISSVVVVMLAVAPASANLLTNGGFEAGDLSGWTTYGVGNGARTGNYFGMTPAEGNWFNGSVASFGTNNGGVFQQVALGPGSYTLTAQLQGYNNSSFVYVNGQASAFPNDTWSELRVDLNGGTDPNAAGLLVSGQVGGIAGWLPGMVNFTLAAPATVTVFAHMNQSFAFAGNWTGVDDVQLVPEPATALLLGFLGLLLLRRR